MVQRGSDAPRGGGEGGTDVLLAPFYSKKDLTDIV